MTGKKFINNFQLEITCGKWILMPYDEQMECGFRWLGASYPDVPNIVTFYPLFGLKGVTDRVGPVFILALQKRVFTRKTVWIAPLIRLSLMILIQHFWTEIKTDYTGCERPKSKNKLDRTCT